MPRLSKYPSLLSLAIINAMPVPLRIGEWLGSESLQNLCHLAWVQVLCHGATATQTHCASLSDCTAAWAYACCHDPSHWIIESSSSWFFLRLSLPVPVPVGMGSSQVRVSLACQWAYAFKFGMPAWVGKFTEYDSWRYLCSTSAKPPGCYYKPLHALHSHYMLADYRRLHGHYMQLHACNDHVITCSCMLLQAITCM